MRSKDIIQKYLSKQKTLLLTDHIPKSCPDLIVVIPCHNEPDIIPSINALYQNERNGLTVMVIVVINHGEGVDKTIIDQNEQTFKAIEKWNDINNEDSTFILKTIRAFDLPNKKAGVGLARKIGMDEACRIYAIHDKNGPIACYDADSLCQKNYCMEVKACFEKDEKLDAISIHFEHPVSGKMFDSSIYQAILQYELHLRYFIEMQKRLSLPFAYHTVGSSMAVKAASYAKFGGMNVRKAGEDFYFLQKIIENGKVRNLGTTMVIPSPRTSDRVPFGTGKAINDMIEEKEQPVYYTYHPQSFSILKPFVSSIKGLYDNDISAIFATYPKELKAYFEEISFLEKVVESKENTATFYNFRKRLFKHFNAFQLMKYLHFMRDHFYPNLPVEKALLMENGQTDVSLVEELLKLRQAQKNQAAT